MTERDEGDAAASIMPTQYFFLVVTGVVAIIYGVMHPEQRLLGFGAGAAFILVGGFFLVRGFRKKRRSDPRK